MGNDVFGEDNSQARNMTHVPCQTIQIANVAALDQIPFIKP